MCSFVLQHRTCRRCRDPLGDEKINHRSCGLPRPRCRGKKKQATTSRFVEPEECDRCSLEMLEMERLEQEEKERLAQVERELAGDDADPDEPDYGMELPPERPLNLGLLLDARCSSKLHKKAM